MRRSLANYRRSDVRSKPHVKGIIHKRQRTLGEFKIPTTAILPLRKRDGMNVIQHDDSPIVLDEDGTTLYQDDMVEEGKMIISSQEDIEYNEEIPYEVEDNEKISYEIESNEIIYSSEPVPLLQEEIQDDIIEIIEPENDTIQDYEIIEESQGGDGDIIEISEGVTDGNISKENRVMECPICRVDISNLELYAREAHCEQCLDKSLPQRTSPKRSLSQNLKKVPEANKEKSMSLLQTPKKVTKVIKKVRSMKRRPPLPSIKILTFHSGYKIVVDGFNFDSHPEINKYFLSHFHADHYIGIGKTWNQGIIYCSEITSKLLQVKFKISPETIIELVNDEWVKFTDYIDVMTMDANHCPGASIFLFREKNEEGEVVKRILHTGDFRVTESLSLKIASLLDGAKIDQIYLDTTYLNDGNSHPTQAEVIDKTAKYMKSYFKEIDRKQLHMHKNGNILDRLKGQCDVVKRNIILVGSYSIGKEKLAQGIARELNDGNKRIYINEGKDLRQYFIPANGRLLNLHEDIFVDVHIVPLRILKDDTRICEYIRQHYDGLTWLDVNLVGIIPTGWTFHGVWGYRRRTYAEKVEIVKDTVGKQRYGSHIDDLWFDEQVIRRDKKRLKERGKFDIFNVPYSEHSSFPELIQFMCGLIRWDEIIPTVNVDKLDDMVEWFDIVKSGYNEDTMRIQ
ncbi:DNA cross-link repair protein Pso2p/SNM1 [Monosporozyma servazzii]